MQFAFRHIGSAAPDSAAGAAHPVHTSVCVQICTDTHTHVGVYPEACGGCAFAVHALSTKLLSLNIFPFLQGLRHGLWKSDPDLPSCLNKSWELGEDVKCPGQDVDY